jgi:hypothetical protein
MKKKIVEPHTNIFRTESVLLSKLSFGANTSVNGDATVVFGTNRKEF